MHSNKIIDRKIISELIIELLSTACLVCLILFFCSMSNQYYQTLKDIYAAKAVFMFALYLLFLQSILSPQYTACFRGMGGLFA